jgi:hypothetical protein
LLHIIVCCDTLVCTVNLKAFGQCRRPRLDAAGLPGWSRLGRRMPTFAHVVLLSVRVGLLSLRHPARLRVAGCKAARLQAAGCKVAICKAAGGRLRTARLQAAGCALQGCRLQAARLQAARLQIAVCKGHCMLQGCRQQGCRLQVAGCRGRAMGAHSEHSGRAPEDAKTQCCCILLPQNRYISRAPALAANKT